MYKSLSFVEKYKIGITIGFIFIINFILKSLFITHNDIANDEPFSIFHAQMPLQDVFDILKHGNNPPLYEFFLHFWIKLFGISAFSVRLPSVIFSSLTAVVIFWVVKKLFHFKEALTATFIFTCATIHIYFAHEARVYALFVLLSSLSLVCYVNFYKKNNIKNQFYLIIINTLLLYTHYFAFFVIINQWIGLIILPYNKKIIRSYIVGFLISLLFFLPLLLPFLNQFLLTVNRGTWVSPPHWSHIYGFINIFLNIKYVSFAFLFYISIALAIEVINKKTSIKHILLKNRYFFLITAWFVCPYTLMFVASYYAPMFIERYILFTSVFLYMFLGIFIWKLGTDSLFKKIAIGLCLLMLPLFLNLKPTNKRNLAETVSYIKTVKTAQDVLFICPDYSYFGFTYYYNKAIFKDYVHIIKRLNTDNIFLVPDLEAMQSLLPSFADRRIIYLQAGTEYIDPENDIFQFLEKNRKFSEKRNFFEIYSVSLFE